MSLGLVIISGTNVFNFLLMTAKDYLTALKVIREIQRKQAYCSGTSQPFLADTLKTIELYCPLDFSKTCGRVTKEVLLSSYNGKLFNT